MSINGVTAQSYEKLCETFAKNAHNTLSKAGRNLDPFFADHDNFDWYSELRTLFTLVDGNIAADFSRNIDLINQTNALISNLGQNVQNVLTHQREITTLITEIESHLSVNSTAAQPMTSELKRLYKNWHKAKLDQKKLKIVVNTLDDLVKNVVEKSDKFVSHMQQVCDQSEAFMQYTNALYADFTNYFQGYLTAQANILHHLTEAKSAIGEFISSRNIHARFLMSP